MENEESYRLEKKELKTQIKPKINDFKETGWKLFSSSLEIYLPIRTYSEANCTEPWRKRYKRHQLQKKSIFWSFLEIKHFLKLPCTITLTRYAPNELDFYDNLPMSFKWILDSICDILIPGLKAGRADNDKRIKVKYNQIKNKSYFIKIEIDWSEQT